GADVGHIELSCDIFDHRDGQPALGAGLGADLPLGKIEKRHHGRTLTPRGVARDDLLGLLGIFGRPGKGAPARADFGLVRDLRCVGHQRSHSPKTTSIAPMIAVVSASMWPFAIMSIACRCETAAG